jgi:hypothetical protein
LARIGFDQAALQVISRCRTISPKADDGLRTRDLWLGKPTLYQLSYVRAAAGLGRAGDSTVAAAGYI